MGKLEGKELLKILEKQTKNKFVQFQYLYLKIPDLNVASSGKIITKNNSTKIGIVVMGVSEDKSIRYAVSLCSHLDGFNSVIGKICALKRLLKHKQNSTAYCKYPYPYVNINLDEDGGDFKFLPYLRVLNQKKNNKVIHFLDAFVYVTQMTNLRNRLIDKIN